MSNHHEKPPRKHLVSNDALFASLRALPDDHPFNVSLRTYALALSFSLGPALFSLVASGKVCSKGPGTLLHVLKRELGASGFAFAMTVGVGGGVALQRLWDAWERTYKQGEAELEVPNQELSVRGKVELWISRLKHSQKAFAANAISAALAILLLQSGIPRSFKSTNDKKRTSATLPLTLLLLVRAMDAVVRATFFPVVKATDDEQSAKRVQERRQRLTSKIDSFVFWASTARIMWCFFYEPQRLPRSYNKWIMAIANIDPRILAALRAIRSGEWSYRTGSSAYPDLVSSLARDIGYPSTWGDISRIPAYGSPRANNAWKALGVNSRAGLGGIPCELVHGGVGGESCTANAALRGAQAFTKAIAIYLPVHFLPIIISRPRSLLRLPNVLSTLLSVLRSASFLSTFVSSIWISVCLTRTLLLARLFPFISHDFWDGPFGCTFAGSLACGASIWVEQGRRRGEMALYVLPRALRALLPEQWLKTGRRVRLLERIAFVLSLATLLTISTSRPDALRGLSRWTLAFVLKGRNAGTWKRKSVPNAQPTLSSPGESQTQSQL